MAPSQAFIDAPSSTSRERVFYCATIWMRKSDNQGENL
jgi:hypothetical protein